jgi:hypothetical protein
MAALPLTPSTELDAINTLLSVIGEAPVNTVENTGLTTADMARATLHEVSRSIQSEGWHFNTETGVVLTPDVTQFIQLPPNTLRLLPRDDFTTYDVTIRGTKLYDRKNRTSVFTASVTVDYIAFLGFEDLPESARYYITILACEEFQTRVLGAPDLNRFNEKNTYRAKANLTRDELRNRRANVCTDSYTAARITNRRI